MLKKIGPILGGSIVGALTWGTLYVCATAILDHRELIQLKAEMRLTRESLKAAEQDVHCIGWFMNGGTNTCGNTIAWTAYDVSRKVVCPWPSNAAPYHILGPEINFH